MNSRTQSYKDLIVWQRSIELVTAIYEVSAEFPREEQYGLTSQMRRAAISISSNIAEGRHRSTRKDYLSFLYNAYSSGAELETQIIICKRLVGLKNLNYGEASDLLNEVMRMLNVMIHKLRTSKASEASQANMAIS